MNTSKRKYALTAGISLLVMSIVAAFSFGYAHGSLFHGDPNEIVTNLNTSQNLFLAEITGWVIVLLCDVLVAWALYHYLKEVQNNISLGTAILRLFYAAVLGSAIFQLFEILNVIQMKENVPSSIPIIVSHLESFEKIWSLGLIIFGIHLLGLGYLTILSSSVPRIWGWLLLFAGVCYFVIHLAKNSLPEYETQIKAAEMILALPMAIAEIGFAIWLLFRGRKVTSTEIA